MNGGMRRLFRSIKVSLPDKVSQPELLVRESYDYVKLASTFSDVARAVEAAPQKITELAAHTSTPE